MEDDFKSWSAGLTDDKQKVADALYDEVESASSTAKSSVALAVGFGEENYYKASVSIKPVGDYTDLSVTVSYDDPDYTYVYTHAGCSCEYCANGELSWTDGGTK